MLATPLSLSAVPPWFKFNIENLTIYIFRYSLYCDFRPNKAYLNLNLYEFAYILKFAVSDSG